MSSPPGSSEDIIVEVDLETGDVVIVPQSGGVYEYNLADPTIENIVNRLKDYSQYTVYVQGETYTQEDIQALREFYGL